MPDLSDGIGPLVMADDVAAALADPALEAEVLAILEEEMQRRDGARLEREHQAERTWRPSYRCDHCHGYTSSAQSECTRCGHVGASADEGLRTSYARAHARRGPRKALRR